MSESEVPEKSLTPKQDRFCQEYMIDLNATQAAIRSGYSLDAKASGYYVYLLCDPRNGEIFYVGKGKGRRMLTHDGDRRSTSNDNPRKLSKILEIRSAGLRTRAYVFASCSDEAEAFLLERGVIAAIGPERLTNYSSGVVTVRERARLLISQTKSFNHWLSEEPRRWADVALYWFVVDGLESLASTGAKT